MCKVGDFGAYYNSKYVPESKMKRRKSAYRITGAVYCNPSLNRKFVNLSENLQTIQCILNRIEKIQAIKKLRK